MDQPVNQHERGNARLPAGFVDRCSSAPWFNGWNRPRELVFGCTPEIEDEPPVVAPRTWLLCTGYKRAGPIDPDEAPGGILEI